MLKTFVIGGLVLAAVGAIGITFGVYGWKENTRDLHRRLDAARLPVKPQVVDFRELEGLPAPVQRYFRLVLKEGQPMVTKAHVEHHGTFNMGDTSDQWKPFTSNQLVITRRPGFDWDGMVKIMPGVTVRVHDAYVAGEGILHAALLGLVSLVDMRGTGEIAKGELMRFFAEAAWYPTALLPSQGVTWEGVDTDSARATLSDGTISLTMLFRFNQQGLIERVRAEARGRTVGNRIVPTPWEGRFWNYQKRDGMVVPLDGEVAWLPPEGIKPYWRGHIAAVSYEFSNAEKSVAGLVPQATAPN